ncbi:MAG: tRNA (N(6)-L-threonylcarbamoyladenosine(37)-C(2))-methylthiotransferase MtaB [Nitrospinae bacterium]|nr:tRNA (N(6)-L-threonylcarbamoyladenosine(37)-C(2))-methylthiotransferase MtaB [Nitrospinota bacterium]
MKVSFETIGCRFNQFETAEMEELFRSAGFEVVPFTSDASIYIINTCTVTDRSDYRCRQTIRKAIRKKGDAFIIVTGCYSQINPSAIASIKGVDLILGNSEKLNILEHLKKLTAHHIGMINMKKLNNPEMVVSNMDKGGQFTFQDVSNFSGRTSAYLKVQTGCNRTCSFCIITVARGPSISEKPEAILRQASVLADSGFKEIVLTGVNLGSYGRDLYPEVKLSDLIEMLMNVEGIERIRLSSINPEEISKRLISVMKANRKVCRHLHIPLQSGDDEVLKRMRRNYCPSMYRELIMSLKNEMPDIGIGADVIVGFPGEDEGKFNNTYKLIDELPLSYLHVFTYSQREGTDAYGYGGQIPEIIKKERNSIIKGLGKKKSNTFRRDFLGKVCRVLIESTRDRKTGLLRGYTDNYIPVEIHGGDEFINRLTSVRITHIQNDTVRGELLDE